MPSGRSLSPWTVRLDGCFLILAGGAALLMETIGHFLGIGPLASTLESPHTIGGFEAHGLAVLIGVLLVRAADLPERRMWHVVGLVTHVFLGGANLLFWNSFVVQDLVLVGWVSTIFHFLFIAAHGACLRAGARGV